MHGTPLEFACLEGFVGGAVGAEVAAVDSGAVERGGVFECLDLDAAGALPPRPRLPPEIEWPAAPEVHPPRAGRLRIGTGERDRAHIIEAPPRIGDVHVPEREERVSGRLPSAGPGERRVQPCKVLRPRDRIAPQGQAVRKWQAVNRLRVSVRERDECCPYRVDHARLRPSLGRPEVPEAVLARLADDHPSRVPPVEQHILLCADDERVQLRIAGRLRVRSVFCLDLPEAAAAGCERIEPRADRLRLAVRESPDRLSTVWGLVRAARAVHESAASG